MSESGARGARISDIFATVRSVRCASTRRGPPTRSPRSLATRPSAHSPSFRCVPSSPHYIETRSRRFAGSSIFGLRVNARRAANQYRRPSAIRPQQTATRHRPHRNLSDPLPSTTPTTTKSWMTTRAERSLDTSLHPTLLPRRTASPSRSSRPPTTTSASTSAPSPPTPPAPAATCWPSRTCPTPPPRRPGATSTTSSSAASPRAPPGTPSPTCYRCRSCTSSASPRPSTPETCAPPPHHPP